MSTDSTRTALQLNALFSAASGMTLLLVPARLFESLGIPGGAPLVAMAVGLMGFAVWVWRVAAGDVFAPSTLLIVVLDVFWVVGSALALITGSPRLTPGGRLLV